MTHDDQLIYDATKLDVTQQAGGACVLKSEDLYRLIAVVREDCAKVLDGWTHADGDRCAEAIRARGQS